MLKKLLISVLLLSAFCGTVNAGQSTKGVINKFGRADAGVQTTPTDIWDLADSTPTQPIWIAPTEARIHAIVSSSTDDDGSPAGLGAHTITVFGLQTWDSRETSESVTMDGTTPVNTSNSYEIIHRMVVVASGTGSINIGNIKATAATDLTITAQINIGQGQTQMAIYGIPSIQTLILDDWYGTLNKGQGTTGTIDFSFLVNSFPETGTTTAFVIKNTRGTQANGTSNGWWPWVRGLAIPGPAIIKIQGVASTNDIEGSGGFNGKLQEN